jgi:inosose dehydratase
MEKFPLSGAVLLRPVFIGRSVIYWIPVSEEGQLATVNRRDFLKKGSTALALLVAPGAEAKAPLSRAQRLHIGAQTNAFGVPIKSYPALLQILDTLARLNYTGFETSLLSLQPDFAKAAACRKDFESRHVRLIDLYCGARLFDKEKVPREIERLRRIAGYIAQMGGRRQVVGSSGFPRPGGRLDVNAMHVWTGALNRLGAEVKAEGVSLCYHNHQQEFEGHPNPMSFLLRDTDPKLVWLNFDVGHAVGLVSPAAFSAQHFRRIAIYHLKDVKLEPSGKVVYTPFGAGQVNLKGVVAPLLSSDWEGWLEVEEERNYPRPTPHPVQTLRSDREYLRKITGV